MRITTCMKRFALTALMVAMLAPTTYVEAKVLAGPANQAVKARRGEKTPTNGKRLTPRMMQMQGKTIKSSENSGAIPNSSNLMRKSKKKVSTRLPMATAESAATLYGNLIFANDWTNSYAPIGIHSIDPNTGAMSAVALDNMLMGAGTYVDGKVYISYSESFLGFILGIYTIEFDVEQGTVLNVIEHGTETMENYANNMAYDPSEDVIYSLNYNAEGTAVNLCKFDRKAFTYSVVAPSEAYIAMSFDAEGNLYMINNLGEVYSVDKSNGMVGNKVATVDYQPQYMQSACWSPRDKKIIWAASNDNDSRLIAIDPATGTSEVLCVFQNAEEFTCLYSTDPLAPDGAPASPSVEVSYEVLGSLEASIEVTAPTTNVAGENLDADEMLTMKVFIDDVEFQSVEKKPGAGISASTTLTEGSHTVTAYCTNSVGDGITKSVKTYAGEDTPTAVKELTVSIADDGKATLTWTAPTEGINKGWVNPATLHYTILRNDVEVASNVKACTYTDQLTGEVSSYVYTVTAFSNEKEGLSASTDKYIYGSAIDLPYEQEFNDASSADLYTFVDNNMDGKTWSFDNVTMGLSYAYSTVMAADDYAFTPKLNLSAERMVNLEVSVRAEFPNFPERIEVTVGANADPASQTVVIPATDVTWKTPQTLQTFFKVPSSGEYQVGLHAISDADMYYLVVSDIKVSVGPAFGAPRAVTEAVATPAAQGALGATVSFKAPTLSFNDQTLAENVTVKVFRGDTTLVGEKAVAPGATGSVVDNAPANGFNSYVIRTYNAEGEGESTSVSCFCGLDTPGMITDFKIMPNADNMSAVISWAAPTTGVNGGYVNPADLKYTIYIPDASGQNVEYMDETTELSYTVMTDEEKLAGYEYYISASNSVGESDLIGGIAVLGKPYGLPFEEKMAGSMGTDPWLIASATNATWGTAASTPVGDSETAVAPDGGMFVCYNPKYLGVGQARLRVPKVTLAGANDPVLRFSMYNYNTADDIELAIEVSTDDNLYTTVATKKVNEGEGWTRYEVSLADYKTAPWITIGLNGKVANSDCICIDYVTVENAYENDVKMESLTGASTLVVGEESSFVATVTNKGYNAATFDVKLFVNDAVAATLPQTEAVANGESKTYDFKLTPTVEMLGNITVKAVVEMTSATDEMPDNDAASMAATVKQPKLRIVTDLSGTPDSDLKNVDLTWSAPSIVAEPTIDDFESYESFALEGYGSYTLVDGDGSETYTIQGLNFPNAGAAMSFMVWDPQTAGATSEIWQAHSGNKCLVSFAATSARNDDYLISPQVAGGSEISFFATIPTLEYGPESFEVLYSSTTTDVEAFTILASESVESIGWTKYEYTLPADAKYFAIHYTSFDVFALLVDDLTYTEAGAAGNLVIMGYNVYCNGNLATASPITETSYKYMSDVAASNLSFNVTVVYDEGESLKSNTVTFTSGLRDVKELGAKIYGKTQYIKVENVAGRTVSVYAADGKLVSSVKATENEVVIPADRGIYVVKVDNTAVSKVQVK